MKRNKGEYSPPTRRREMQGSRVPGNVSFTQPFIQEILSKLGFFVCLFLPGLGTGIQKEMKY